MAKQTAPNGSRGTAAAEKSGSATVATVERAADVLMYFVEAQTSELGVTEIADGLGLSKAAVHRVLSSLRGRDLIELNSSSRRYSLGVGAMRLGLAYLDRIDIRRAAHPELVELSRGTSETATLSVRTGHTRAYVDQVTPDREVIMSVGLGESFPLHAGASSKAFLAFLTEEQIEDYIASHPLEALTSETITDADDLRAELAAIRQQGWARSEAERKGGAASVAAPVFDHTGAPVAVVSVCGPLERFSAEFDACRDALLATTATLSQRMGWSAGS
ncbi:IclR family transcriptional regulator [Ornithinimicrobium faecis]|uniref:IclR family transcriptional regulator n=1 Tax=Ornithinimicrobium faecis TaxID=2934158 RepID=UPI00211879D0|nr:IclR family transcriptional regulator [Ornithinimicrobium sp. HY1745]